MWLTHLSLLRTTFEKCWESQLSLNPLKSHFWVKYRLILGHVVSRDEISIDEAKVKLILKMPPPSNEKQLQGFMGYVGYYRHFIKMFDEKARPMYVLMKQFTWTDEYTRSFRTPQRLPHQSPDSLNTRLEQGVSCTYWCICPHNRRSVSSTWKWDPRPPNYFHRPLVKHRQAKREALVMVYSVKMFWHYVLACRFSFFVDHYEVIYIDEATMTSSGDA